MNRFKKIAASILLFLAVSPLVYGIGEVVTGDGGILEVSEDTSPTLGGNLDAGGNSITNASYLDLDTAGVRLDSDNDGALVITGQGNGSDEALSINLDDTSNTAVLGTPTGVTAVDFGTMNASNVGTLSATSVNATNVTTDNLTANVTLVSAADAQISNASPTINGVDTDTTDDEVSASIDLGHCTDTGSGTEDCDIGFWQKIAGVLTQVGLIDADGSWQILKGMFLSGDLTMGVDSSIQTGTGTGDNFYLNAYDTNGASYDNLLTLTSGDEPSMYGTFTILTHKAGNGTETFRPSGTFCSSATATGNTLTGEDDLISCTMPANTMPNNGDMVVYEGHGTVANNVNAKRIRARIGTALIFDSGALPTSAAIDWALTCKIWRQGATAERASCEWSSNNATVPSLMDVTTPGADLSTSLTLKFTGEAVSTADIVQNAGAASLAPTS